MARLRFADVQSRPTEFLDFTSLTLDEFHQLVPSFEAAFQAHMATRRLDGETPDCPPVCSLQKLPLADARSPAVLPAHVPEDVQPPSRPGAPVRHGPEQSQSMDPRPLTRAVGGPAHPRRCPR